MGKRSAYQEKVIKNYYKNQDSILIGRLQELVTNLYLAEGKARVRYWKTTATALEKLEVPASRIEHILKKDDPALLAQLVEKLLARPT